MENNNEKENNEQQEFFSLEDVFDDYEQDYEQGEPSNLLKLFLSDEPPENPNARAFRIEYVKERIKSQKIKLSASETIELVEEDLSPEQIDIILQSKPVRGEKIWRCAIAILGTLFLAVCLAVGFCGFNQGFAEWFCTNISEPVRIALGYVTSVFPFSVFETMIVIVPVAIGYRVVHAFFDDDYYGKSLILFNRRLACIVIAVAMFVISAFIPLYSVKPVNLRMGFERTPISAKQLTDAASAISAEMNTLIDGGEIIFDADGFSVMPYSFAELSDRVNKAYAGAIETKEFSFLTDMDVPAKPLLLSKPMTYTHLSGVYTPLTGEANINTNYPDYVVAFTCAHELAHQRGVAPEDEASFVAYAVLSQSDDAYLRYCANRYVFDYMLGAVWSADEKAYMELVRSVRREVLLESVAYSQFFDTYDESVASEVADAVNDTSLKINNQSEGTESYGMVVDLVTLYITKQ